MRKTIKSLKSNLKRLPAKNSGLTFEENSELRTTNSELLVKNKGFTLIEIIILIVMAGILLPAIILPFVTGVKSSGKPEMATKAMYLAHQKMEEYMKYDYSLVPTTSTSYVNVDPAKFPNYQWQWQILYVNSTNFNASVSDIGYKKIIVKVSDPESTVYELASVVTNFP